MSCLRVADRLRNGELVPGEVEHLARPVCIAHTCGSQGLSVLNIAGVFCAVIGGGTGAEGDEIEILAQI